MSIRSVLGWTAAGIASFGAACVGYGICEGSDRHIRQLRLPLLPAGSHPIRILHISDIHLMARQEGKLAFLAGLSSLRPDLVINTGDNLSQAEAISPLLDALGPLLDIPGGLVFGSNDYTAPIFKNPFIYLTGRGSSRHSGLLPADDLCAGLTSGRWKFVEDRRSIFSIRGISVELRGTGDAHIGRADWSTVAGARDKGVDLSIGLSHAPYLNLVEAAAADDVDLMFCGHTHGGQVCIPTPWAAQEGRALTTNCDLPTTQAKGLSYIERPHGAPLPLHVSAGLGMSPFAPYRFACPPEVTLLTLVAGE
ncbi:MAG: metallophosphoesterase [Propionibacteriaceae bacterium]